jgi:hypothetical protein
LSVEATQLKPIWLLDAGVAVKFVGAVGGCVSEPPAVAAFAMLEYGLGFPAASIARTWYL